MISFTRIRRFLASRWAAVAAAATLTLALASCSDRLTTVDPSYTNPEGSLSADAQLVVWAEEPVAVTRYADAGGGPLGPNRAPQCTERLELDLGDPVAGVEEFRPQGHPAGSIRTMILDGTPANEYDLLRREINGGYRKVLDFPLRPTRKWLEAGWEAYDHTDPAPSGYEPASYQARGVIGEASSQGSPLTNSGETGSPLQDITFTAPCLPCDSTFRIQWSPVPGAYRYWVHVYQFLISPTPDQLKLSSMPSPVNLVMPRDILVATMDSTVTSYRLRGARYYDHPVPAGVRVLVERGANYSQVYYVRISAVNVRGQMIAISRGDYGRTAAPSGYALHRLSAYLVFPKRPGQVPPFCVP